MRLCGEGLFTKINPHECAIKVGRYPLANILAIILPGNSREYSQATKKYKYDRGLLGIKLKDVWGENIKTIAMLFVLAMAMIAVPAMAIGSMQDGNLANMGQSGVDILGRTGIFETESGACQFSLGQSTNFDSVNVGNDVATALGPVIPIPGHHPLAKATNNLEIKKNQDSGDCQSCCDGAHEDGCDNAFDGGHKGCHTCDNACVKINLEQVKVGNRAALAVGNAEAENNVKIVTNQV